jgi:hypothetical protein
MQFLAPDILVEVRQLPLLLNATAVSVGLLLWLFGARTHRFWLALVLTLSAGLAGLTYGREYSVQPLVAGLLLAVAAGALALSLIRLLLFIAGGVAGLAVVQAVSPGWPGWVDPLVTFLCGGLLGIILYRLWILALGGLCGTLLMCYGTLGLIDRLGRFDSAAWAARNGALLNWGVAALAVTGMLAQFLLDRRRRLAAKKAAEEKAKKEAKPAPPPPAAPPPPPPPPPRPWWKVEWPKALKRKAG